MFLFFFFFNFPLPLGGAGFSPEYPILMVSSVLASPLFYLLCLREEGSIDSPAPSILRLRDANHLYLGAQCCASGNVLREGNQRARGYWHMWAHGAKPEAAWDLPAQSICTADPTRGRCNRDRTALALPRLISSTGENLWQMLWKRHNSSFYIICP